MSGIWPYVGALVLSYLVSRATWRVARPLPSPWRLFVGHGASFVLLALMAGIARAYGRLFALEEATLYVIPTILWLVYDNQRGRTWSNAA